MKLPEFDTRKELFEHLIENKSLYYTQKKETVKEADSLSVASESNGKIIKADSDTDTELKRAAIINTTNVLDSHSDVHLPGIWKRSLDNNKNIYYLQEHEMKFDKVIAKPEDVKASTKYYEWSELGYPFEGKTQALLFEVTVKRDQNKFMFDQFKQGNVNNNSVGMRYVKIELAVDDEDYDDEYAVWNKYIDKIANKDQAIEQGYFWAVHEAKVIEGSAVLMGSNQFTPIRESKEDSSKDTPLDINELRKTIKGILK
jgi:hypothetical protein